MKYKVIAEPITAPMFYEAASEDEAWKKAEQNAKRIGVRLYNGTVEAVPTKADLEARVKELEAVLGLAIQYIDHPEVKSIPFAYPAETVAARIHELLAKVSQ